MEHPEPTLNEEFRLRIERAEQALRRLSEEQAGAKAPPGQWSRKQELGHLLDSAQNNHQRIVLTVLNGGYAGPSYAQNGWVDLHGYDELSWEELLAHWSMRNRLLGRVVARIPAERLEAEVAIESDGAMPLKLWVIDYLQHLEHHVEHITSNI